MTRKLPWLAGLAALLFACLIGFFQIHNADVWWHIAWGEKMLQQLKTFPAAESFYFTPTSLAYLRDLPNTFLGDMGLALLYNTGGTIVLQLLVLACLFIGGAAVILVPLKNSFSQKNSFTYFLALLLFFAFCLGTCQLQIVRNSLFSLAFFPLTLALYDWHCHRGGWKLLVFYPCLFLGWSLMHPSYVLGIIALEILYTGLLLKRSSSLSRSQLLATLFVLLLLLCISLTYSWQVKELLITTATHSIASISKILTITKEQAATHVVSSLTKPVWGNAAAPLSGDFIPTWQVMHHPAAWSSLLLSLIAFLLLLFSRAPNKCGMLALLSFTTYFGICYLRGTGYTTITALFVIASVIASFSFMSFFETWKKITSPLIAIACFLALLGAAKLVMSERSEFFFMEKGRVFGFGKAAVFDDTTYDFVKKNFPEAPCFTTIVTGSYASLIWKGQKKVFIDAFFAPHPNSLWRNYNEALLKQDVTALDSYGIQTAIIENSRIDWQAAFLNSESWRPVAISIGATVYAKKNILPTDVAVKILFTETQLEHSRSPTTRQAVAAAYYNCILALQLHGMIKIADQLSNQHEELFKNLVSYLDASQRENIRQQPKGIRPALLAP